MLGGFWQWTMLMVALSCCFVFSTEAPWAFGGIGEIFTRKQKVTTAKNDYTMRPISLATSMDFARLLSWFVLMALLQIMSRCHDGAAHAESIARISRSQHPTTQFR